MARILVVDDESTIRFLIHKVLEAAGHTVFEAISGPDALNLLASHSNQFDMIVLDLLMPHMDGFEFLTILRRQPCHIPVIIVSALWDSDTIAKALERAVSGHLRKPFSQQKLIDMVDHLLVAHTG
jgi:CheY-like chemotaxis protein